MSSYIGSVIVLKGEPRITREQLLSLLNGKPELPETCFLSRIMPKNCVICGFSFRVEGRFCSGCGAPRVPGSDFFLIAHKWGEEDLISWGGSGSWKIDVLCDLIAQSGAEGVVELLFTWNSGEMTGIRIRNGQVTRPGIRISLEE